MRIAARRLAAQLITASSCTRVVDVVSSLGAMQAQDYYGCLWAVGVRMKGDVRDTNIEDAIARREIVRTHAFRGTWQLIAANDLRWMLSLVSERVIGAASTRHRQLELDATTIKRSNDTLVRALRESDHDLTRDELSAALTRAKISPAGQRFAHLLVCAELDGLICGGARRGKQFTYALVERVVPASKPVDREAALGMLALRYFTSRGPATIDDFTWWTGLPAAETRRAVASVESKLVREDVDGRAHFHHPGAPPPQKAPAVLLPAFDEILVGYRTRDAILDPAHAKRVNAGGGLLDPVVVVEDRVVATWKRTLNARRNSVDITLKRLTKAKLDVRDAAARYARFLGMSLASPYGRKRA